MDVGRSFSFVTQDPDWIKKVLIGAVIALFSFLLVPAFILSGYQLAIVRRVYLGADLPLPEWDDIGGYLVRGLVVTIGVILWTLPLMVLSGFVIVAASVSSDSASGGVALAGICVGVPLALLYAALIMPIVVARYAVQQTFGSMFEISEILTEIRRAPGALLLAVLMSLIAGFIAYFGVIACFIGVYFTTAYAYFVMAHLLGQAYRKARGVESTAVTPSAAF